jgi:molybdopterin-guanine dinucleotide biosynthesis protein A
MMPMFDVHGFILVGGASRRMGRDKATLTFGERTGVEIIAEAMGGLSRFVNTVGFVPHALRGLPNIPDLHKSWGPLAGIEAALRHATTESALIVGCDFPFVTRELFERLLVHADDADAVVPLQADGVIQPLCALYNVTACLPAAAAAIAAGERSPRALLERVRTRYLPFEELADLKGSNYLFFNVNTPESYQRALEIFDQSQR